jgi:hypothetical protein
MPITAVMTATATNAARDPDYVAPSVQAISRTARIDRAADDMPALLIVTAGQ